MPSMKNLGFNDGCGENRKASKPLIEKRRRARINYSLAELKAIVVAEKPHLPTARPPKLEKADILEMAVAYVKKVHEKQTSSPETDQNGYLAGFNECLLKVCKFLDKEIDNELKSRLVMHLNNTANSIHSAESSTDESSCSSNSRSQTPASVGSTETSHMEYHSSSPFTDTEQDVPARTFSVAESYQPCRSSDSYHHSPYAQVRPTKEDSSAYGLYRDSSSSAMNGPLNLAKSASPIRRADQSRQCVAENQLSFFNCDNVMDSMSMWRPWNSKRGS